MPKVKNQTKKVETTTKKNRAEEVRKLLLDATKQIDKSYIDITILAYEVYKDRLYAGWGYQDIKEYAEKELNIKYRKLMNFVNIGEKVKELGLDKNRLDKLGWSKLSAILGIVDKNNIEEWLKNAEGMSTRELLQAVKISKKTDKTKKVPRITTITFRLEEDVADIVLLALETAKSITNSECLSTAIQMICQDWLETQEILVKTDNTEKVDTNENKKQVAVKDKVDTKKTEAEEIAELFANEDETNEQDDNSDVDKELEELLNE